MTANRADVRAALAFFAAQGWTRAQAAGIVANLLAESNLNPAASGDGGQAYGIAQWHPDRQANFAALIGKDIHGSSLEDQLAFVHGELLGSEKAAGEALQLCTTAAEAGACVSSKYERPADEAGEASRRAALATSIFEQYGPQDAPPAAPAQPTPQPIPTAAPAPHGDPMPLLLALLPAVLNLFAPRAQAALQRLTGASPDVVQQFAQTVIGKVQEVTGKSDPVQAVAAITADPKPEQVAVVQESALDHLDKLMPVLEKLGELDKAQWDAETAGRDAASKRAAQDRYDSAPVLVVGGLLMTALIIAALLGMMAWQMYLSDNHDPSVALIALAGPIITLAVKALMEVYAYRFDGNKESSAKDAIITELARK